jgi:hypothetical protein
MDVAPAGGRLHRAVLRVVIVAVVLTACSSAHSAAPTPRRKVTQVRTFTSTRTVGPSDAPTAPVSTGPTSSATARSCPWLDQQTAADQVGMRLERITVQRSRGGIVGCRFYAVQNSPLHQSEHLPGRHQPAIEITTTRYAAARAAHNAFVRLAQRGRSVQQATIGRSAVGLCFQTAFYSRDHGRDWACAVNLGSTLLEVRTVVVSPAFNVIEVARRAADAIRMTR